VVSAFRDCERWPGLQHEERGRTRRSEEISFLSIVLCRAVTARPQPSDVVAAICKEDDDAGKVEIVSHSKGRPFLPGS
jgi:hypothetical protein